MKVICDNSESMSPKLSDFSGYLNYTIYFRVLNKLVARTNLLYLWMSGEENGPFLFTCLKNMRHGTVNEYDVKLFTISMEQNITGGELEGFGNSLHIIQ